MEKELLAISYFIINEAKVVLHTLHCGSTQGCDVVGHSLCILAQDTQLELDTLSFL